MAAGAQLPKFLKRPQLPMACLPPTAILPSLPQPLQSQDGLQTAFTPVLPYLVNNSLQIPLDLVTTTTHFPHPQPLVPTILALAVLPVPPPKSRSMEALPP